MDSKTRQSKLNCLLEELSLSVIADDQCADYTNQLTAIYSNNFRHNYSAFFPIMLNIDNSKEYSSEYLLTNLSNISKYIEQINSSENSQDGNIYRPILKLCDHINLEQSRINQQNVQQNKLLELQQRITEAQQKLDTAIESSEQATKKAAGLQTEMLAILSIFSAVVLAFMGSMTFLGGAMQSLSDVRLYKFFLASCVCGIVIFNTIFLLLYIISKIIDKSIYVQCNSENCTCKDGKPQCGPLNRLRKRLPYVFYFNAAMLLIAVSVAIIHFAPNWAA